jgi:lipopolysaccharide/colanic/teichoic acid biosynthesis glycosyltransferase
MWHDLESNVLIMPHESEDTTQRTLPLLYLCWHTILDIVFGLCGLLVLLLLLPMIALLIRLDSPGSIFYKQERLGCRGRTFSIHKFRSMYINAEQAGHAIWATENDLRVTRVGRFMRATHLDELPQVINILRGEMSLIGPRPERKEFVTTLEMRIPLYRCRLSVKPGLTGWAQVNYPYGNTEHDALFKLHYDLYYIKHRSLTLDILILFKTVIEVVSCRGV